MAETVKQNLAHSMIAQAVSNHDRATNLNIADLQRMERQLIPLLNTVRLMQGKRPVIVPGENRTHG